MPPLSERWTWLTRRSIPASSPLGGWLLRSCFGFSQVDRAQAHSTNKIREQAERRAYGGCPRRLLSPWALASSKPPWHNDLVSFQRRSHSGNLIGHSHLHAR